MCILCTIVRILCTIVRILCTIVCIMCTVLCALCAQCCVHFSCRGRAILCSGMRFCTYPSYFSDQSLLVISSLHILYFFFLENYERFIAFETLKLESIKEKKRQNQYLC